MTFGTDSGYSLYWVVGPGAGSVFDLATDTLSIGRLEYEREERGWIRIPDRTVSRHHADLVWLEEQNLFQYRHKSQTNPSRIDGQIVTQDVLLQNNSQLAIGASQFLLQRRWARTSTPPHPVKKQTDEGTEYFIQLLPGGYCETLSKEEENRLGLDVSIYWEPRYQCFLASDEAGSRPAITRKLGPNTSQNFPFRKPTALEVGDILTVDFCQYLFSQRPSQSKGSSVNSLRTPKSLIPGYRRLKKLGQGSSSEVFLMLDPEGNKVAAKFLLPHLVRNPEARASFEREGQIALSLNHPCLIDVIHVGTNDAQEKYIVSEYLEQGTLRDYLKRHSRLSYKEVVGLAMDLASGLSFLHQRGLVHRDVKPSNIFLRGQRTVLADFGIVKGVDLDTARTTGYTVGTPHYMAPEHFRGFTEPRSDQYALGIVLVELLSGRRVFEASDHLSLAHLHVHHAPDLEEILPDTPPSVLAALQKMLAKTPEERFDDALTAARSFAGV